MYVGIPDIGKEKTEVELRKSIGEFNKANLNPTQVTEKNPLPSGDGKHINSMTVCVYVCAG